MCLCVCFCSLLKCRVISVPRRFSPALDADLRFALDNRPDNDIIRRCLVYIHKVINAKGEREKIQMNSQPQPQPEVMIHCFLMCVALFVTVLLTEYYTTLHFHYSGSPGQKYIML